MPVVVNGYELSDAEMEQELPDHQDAPDPLHSAMTALVLRRVLLDEARKLGLQGADAIAIDALLEQEVVVPTPGLDECLRQYQAHPAHFTVGELVEANHILLQVTPSVDLEGLRKRAEALLAELQEHPERFADLAKSSSNCPSGEVGGSLGQIGRGDTVPEFEKAVFAAQEGCIIPKPVETRFGLHIIGLGRKAAGRLLPFDEVAAGIAEAMQRASRDHALRQYLQLLVGRAQISGIDLAGADTPLVQ
jgi:peptidyl-prolyl cis-trans isomerase C